MLRDITVLMSASSSPSMPGMIKCLRNNGERNIKVVGIDMTSDPSAKFMVDSFYQVPAANDPGFCDLVLDICKKEKVDVYFPNVSAEVEAVVGCGIGQNSICRARYVDFTPGEERLVEVHHPAGVGHHRVAACGEFVGQEKGIGKDPKAVALDHDALHEGVGRVVVQLDVEEVRARGRIVGRGAGLQGDGVGQVRAQPHGVACLVAVAVGLEVDFLLRRVGKEAVETG